MTLLRNTSNNLYAASKCSLIVSNEAAKAFFASSASACAA